MRACLPEVRRLAVSDILSIGEVIVRRYGQVWAKHCEE